jgi:hypothetical protein
MDSEAVHNDEADHNDEEASCLDDEACLDADGDHSEVVVAVHDYTVDHDSMEVVDLDREGQGQAHAVPFGKERVVPFREEVQEQSRHEDIGTLGCWEPVLLVDVVVADAGAGDDVAAVAAAAAVWEDAFVVLPYRALLMASCELHSLSDSHLLPLCVNVRHVHPSWPLTPCSRQSCPTRSVY